MMSAGIGRLHPVFVHLPIGILLFVAVLFFLSKKQKFANLTAAIAPGLAIGTLFAIASCVTGYLLSISDTYNEAAIFKHQWLGIATAIVGGISYFAYQKESKFFGAILIVLSTLIIITGHYGGSLTHGEDYLTAPLLTTKSDKKIIANINEAIVYKDIIEPILATKCYSCHGESKQKGKLRLDLPNYILQGGEEGKVLTPYQPGSSELINRLLLPTSNEEHMPPKEKPQLTKEGVAIVPIVNGSNYVRANLIGVETLSANTFQLLSKISDQLLQLNASFTAINDEHLSVLSNCKQLKQLELNGASITNKGLTSLDAFENLETLSITQTKATAEGISGLTKLKNLKKLYLYKTNFTNAAIAQLKQKMPGLRIDTGGYTLPILVTDTTEAKAPEIKTN